jgi:hypothetical protein
MALEQAYAAPRGVSTASVEFAKQFEVETVYEQYWKPFLKENL